MLKRFLIGFLFLVYLIPLCIFLAPVIYAEEDGGDIIFKDTKKQPYILFSHSKHKEKGNKCEDCHTKIFQKKAGTTDERNAMTMKTLKRGKYCGTCHNGKKAFKVMSKCKKCHSFAK